MEEWRTSLSTAPALPKTEWSFNVSTGRNSVHTAGSAQSQPDTDRLNSSLLEFNEAVRAGWSFFIPANHLWVPPLCHSLPRCDFTYTLTLEGTSQNGWPKKAVVSPWLHWLQAGVEPKILLERMIR